MVFDEARDGAAEDHFRRKRARTQHQFLASQGAVADDFVLQRFCHACDLARMLDQHASQVGRHHAVAFAQEQWRPGLGLQRLDAAGKRRLAEVQRRGRLDEAAVLIEGQEMLELSEFYRHAQRV